MVEYEERCINKNHMGTRVFKMQNPLNTGFIPVLNFIAVNSQLV